MPILQVDHTTTYIYRRAVEIGAHRLMLRPRDSHELRVLSTELICEPAASLAWSLDVFGNSIAHAAFSNAADTLSIISRVTVEQFAVEWPVFAISAYALNYPFAYTLDEQIDLGALRNTQYVDESGALTTWAKGFVRSHPTDTLSLLKDLNGGVNAQISYQNRDDEGTQGPLETLARGLGTCRDFAVLFAEAARALGFGARICSGYLYNPTSVLAGSQGAGSTHAWAEIYLPGAGWIAFDPTNRAVGGAHLIRVAVARTIEQTAPIIGSFVGVGDDFLRMDVAVSV